MSKLIAKEYKRFEDIKKVREDGSEYWSARELALALDYTKWENFHKVINRAMVACENSGHNSSCDFAEVSKIVEAGATSKPKLDYELTRYACYLIVQNGDPRKEVIALGQTYFAIQSKLKELGIARCGLACCLCSENEHCGGCDSGNCPDAEWCENRKCSIEKNIGNCFLCEEKCRKGLLSKIKPYGFTLFAKRYGIDTLLKCLEENEKNGIVYHRQGIVGDYDDFDDVEELIRFIQTGKR